MIVLGPYHVNGKGVFYTQDSISSWAGERLLMYVSIPTSSMRFIPSLFSHRPPTIYFDYPVGPSRNDEHFELDTEDQHPIFYRSAWKRKCITDTFSTAGLLYLKENCRKENRRTENWTCAWTNHFATERLKTLNRFQKVNHFPGSWCIGRKDNLCTCLRQARRHSRNPLLSKRKFVNAYDHHPETWILPKQYKEWSRVAKNDLSSIFILKPSAASCGRGIKLIDKRKRKLIPQDRPCILQRYIKDPYLINGKKFDLRLYVLVTSYDPLTIFLFTEGLVRFSSCCYTLRNLSNRYSHLTNVAVNLQNKENDKLSNFSPGTSTKKRRSTETTTRSGKWTLEQLWCYLGTKESAESIQECKEVIDEIIVKTIIASEAQILNKVHSSVKSPKTCFELFGFDVLLDKTLKPWLLEVNISPSLMVRAMVQRVI